METGMVGSVGLYGIFLVMVLGLLALDLGVFHRRPHEVKFREALSWSIVWVVVAGLFNLGVWVFYGSDKGLEFLAGYVIEKSLAVDNLFVLAALFSMFAIPKPLQHRVLFLGILGALIMRGLFIVAGATLLSSFHWLILLFGGLLIATGIKLLVVRDSGLDPTKNPLFRLITKFFPLTSQFHGDRFLVRVSGKLYGTPLFAALIAIEVADLIFAVDSIPAVFAVTRDPFIVLSSNVFAILGLRSLYFLLAGVIDKLYYLRTGLACVLVFVGIKMLLSSLMPIPVVVSLVVIATILTASVIASLLRGLPRSSVAGPAPTPPTPISIERN